MNKKFLLAAMALPMLFTACSQDELFEDYANNGNMPDAKGYYMTLAPTLGDMADSRATWLDSNAKLVWDNTDKISVYWLGDNQSVEGAGNSKRLKGMFNSIFKTEDGNAFTSESMVFEGGNIAVYPGNTSFVRQGDIMLNVPLSQDENTIKEVPYISNYLNISDVTVANPNQSEQLAGYNNGLYAPMKLGANVLYLNLELANTANLAAYGFKVDSVSFVNVATKTEALTTFANAFAKEAGLKIDNVLPFDQHKVHVKDAKGETPADSVETILKSVRVAASATANTLTSKAVTSMGNGKYQVKFVVLPTTGAVINENAEIVIYTNCGRINLTTTKTVTAAGSEPTVTNQSTYVAPGENETNITWAGLVSGKTQVVSNETVAVTQTIDDLLTEITTAQTMPTGKGSNFENEQVGLAYMRTIKADMANATLNNSVVKSSEEIMNYVAIYTAMNSKEKMNLILSADEGSIFKSLTKEAIAAIDAKNNYTKTPAVLNVSLSMDAGMTGIEVVGGGEVYSAGKSLVSDAALVLEAGKEWTMNDDAKWDNVSSIVNNGTLTVAGTAKKGVQNSLTEVLVNNGTLKIGGNNTLQVGTKLQNVSYEDDDITINGTIEIAAGQNLVFNQNVTGGIQGTINVAQGGFLTVSANKTVVNEAEINNYGLVSAEDGNGGLTNKGIINVKRNGAITYVQDNANGIINLLSRNNEAVVKGTQGKIVYNYASATDGTTFVYKPTDKFTYVIFGEGNESITLAEVKDGQLSIESLSFKFTDETNLITTSAMRNTHFETLEVAAGAHLQVLSDNAVSVHHLINNGIITVGGTISYLNTYAKANNAKVYSVGNGAIVYNAAKAGTLADVQKAIKDGQDIVLTAPVTLTDADLAKADGITIQGATASTVLTIDNTTASKVAVFENVVNLKNLTVAIDVDGKSGSVGNEWYSKMPLFKSASTFENVTFAKPIIVAADANFKNVKFNIDPSIYDSFALIVAPFGQTVTLNECEFEAVRGIQISDQMKGLLFDGYTNATVAKAVKLNLTKTSFETTEKAAIMVRNGGATINVSNVDITKVTADKTNIAWLDEDATCEMKDVVVIGGKVVQEQ